ncbi:MAG: response regulator [Blastochloris sp.]|nr:response regulator [Blastochloris sp.]
MSSASPPQILLIEDEPAIRRMLRAGLSGYQLHEAATGREGLRLAAVVEADAIILDLGLPDMDGLEVVRALRGWSTTPISVLTARGHESDKIAALDAGADDYVTKPFAAGELQARLRAALRRRNAPQQPEEPVVQFGPLAIDLQRQEVRRNGAVVHLSPTEYRLLAVLVQRADTVVTQRQLLDSVWGLEYADAAHYVRIYMQRLRQKLETNPARPAFLLTEVGVGYRLRRDR